MKAIIMKGLPGSGKSTRASKQEGYTIISRDTLRLQNPGMKESQIKDLERSNIKQFYGLGKDIIVDNTHMNISTAYSIIEFCENLGYEVTIQNMRIEFRNNQTYLDECLKRNNFREAGKIVPDSVIYEMYLGSAGLFDKLVICDIDGTIADLTHRLHYIKQEKKDHDGFYAEVINDAPITAVIDVIKNLSISYKIALVSGRRNDCCKDTQKWLEKYDVPYDYLLMRNSWDRRDDVDVKSDIYEKCLVDKYIVCVFDDRKRVIDMRREKGFFVFNCAQGDNDF